MRSSALIASAVTLLAAGVRASNNTADLILLTDAAAQFGATCLDGSPAAIYL